jgi:cysteine synthase
MGTTGTIIGTSSYLKEKNPAIQIVGAQPSDGSQIPGIRKCHRNIYQKYLMLIKLIEISRHRHNFLAHGRRMNC